MRPPADASRRHRAPLVLVPWLVYLAVTVVAPAANGAARDAGFAEHAVITFGVSGALLMLWLAAGRGRPGRTVVRTNRGEATGPS